jgi:hypothetical protein
VRLRIKDQFRAGKATNEDGNHNPRGRRKKSGRPAGRTEGGQDTPNLSVFSANLPLSALWSRNNQSRNDNVTVEGDFSMDDN